MLRGTGSASRRTTEGGKWAREKSGNNRTGGNIKRITRCALSSDNDHFIGSLCHFPVKVRPCELENVWNPK